MAICPYCGSEIEEGTKYCAECGAPVASVSRARREEDTAMVGSTGLLLGQAARQARLEAVYEEDQLIGARAYNGVILGVLLWGFLINVLLCVYVG
ncbi:MAG: zinc ribbon domain-containing protein, partial [Clostridia bacterium]